MAYKSTRNFHGPKPRVYWLGDGWWRCKHMVGGQVIGFGKARQPETAYNAFIRSQKVPRHIPLHWRGPRGSFP